MHFRKLIASVMLCVMMLTIFSGCGGNSNGLKQAVTEPGENGKITKEPLELKMHMMITTDAYDYDKVKMFGEAFEKTNIKVVGSGLGTGNDVNSAFNIMMVSNPLPDIIHGTKSNLMKYATEGAFVNLDPYINAYAPNIKKFFEENEWARKGSLAADGKLYYIPHIRYGTPMKGFYIRTDWLEKLGLDVPKTTEEFYNVLKAFRERDPNGNGIKDEVPYFYRDKGVDDLLQLFGVKYSWYITGDGKCEYGKVQPEMKTAATELARWYKEGLVDQEIYTRGSSAREQLLGGNVGGATHDWFTTTASFNDKYTDSINGFAFEAIAPPADINGKVKEDYARKLLSGNGWAISKDNRYIVETIKFFDFWYSEEGIRLFNYGVEGVDYNMVDGKPVYTDTVLKAEGGAPDYLRKIGKNELGSMSLIESEVQTMNAQARKGFSLYADNNYCSEQFPDLTFTTEEQRIIKEKETAINTYVSEKMQAWIMGNESPEENFDEYIATVKSMGYDELRTAYQNAYDRYMKQ